MNIGNITSNNFDLDNNGKDMQIEVYEQLIEQLQQENKKYKERINKAIDYIKLGKIFDNEDIRKVVDKIQNDLLEILGDKE